MIIMTNLFESIAMETWHQKECHFNDESFTRALSFKF